MLETKNIVGIHTRDPHVAGTLYLTKDGTLTRNVKNADLIDLNRMHKAIRQIRVFSSTFFTLEVADDALRH